MNLESLVSGIRAATIVAHRYYCLFRQFILVAACAALELCVLFGFLVLANTSAWALFGHDSWSAKLHHLLFYGQSVLLFLLLCLQVVLILLSN